MPCCPAALLRRLCSRGVVWRVVSQVLAKALVHLQDFRACHYLCPDLDKTPEEEKTMEFLINGASLLEAAKFAEFWAEVRRGMCRHDMPT